MKKLAQIALTLLMAFSYQLVYASPVFIENKGQWNSDVLFAARLKGMSGLIFSNFKALLS
jgi:hypothetical protein